MVALKLGSSHRRHIILIVMLLLAIGLRLFYFVGIGINDDTEYSSSAFHIASGRKLSSYPIGSIDSARFGMILPVAFFYRLFGVNDLTSSLYPLFCSIFTILLAYMSAKILFSWEVAVGAALMLTFFPLDIVYCTQLVPTVPLACALTGSLLCFITGDRLYKSKQHYASRKANLCFLGSGLFIGVGWLINELFFLFWLVILLYLLFEWKFHVAYLFCVVGAVGVFLAESLFFKILTGEFWWRIKVVQSAIATYPTNTALSYYPITFFTIRNIDFSAGQGHFGFFWYLFVVSSFYLLIFRKKQIFFLLFGMWGILCYFQFGVNSLEGHLIAKWIRYMEMLLPFVTMIAGFAVMSFGKMGIAKWKGWVLLAVFLGTNVWFIPRVVEANRTFTRPLKQIAGFLRQLPDDKPIYLDAGAIGHVDIYLGRKRAVRFLEGSRFLAVQDAYVVLNGSRGIIENQEMRSRLPKYGKLPHSSWKLLTRIDAPVYGDVYPFIFYAPENTMPFRVDSSQGEEEDNSETLLEDRKHDVVCSSSKSLLDPAFIDIIRSSSYIFENEFLTCEMKLGSTPDHVAGHDFYIAYIWSLDLDQNPNTGYKTGGLGVEFNIRLAKNGAEDNWKVYMDDMTPDDAYEFRNATIGFSMKNTLIRVRIPTAGFSRFERFDWNSGTLLIGRTGQQSIDCHDQSQSDVFYGN